MKTKDLRQLSSHLYVRLERNRYSVMLDTLGVAAELQIRRTETVRRKNVVEQSVTQARSRDQQLRAGLKNENGV